MTREEVFEAWAPPASTWSQWVKPVLFAHVPASAEALTVDADTVLDAVAERLPDADGATALVLDLPGSLGVWFAEALVERGFRPVPLYNSCPPPERSFRAGIDVYPILDALVAQAAVVGRAKLPNDAPPAFLLDSGRRTGRAGHVMEPGTFDNRSISLPTDFPSYNFLRSHGIERAVLIQERSLEPEADLSHTLMRWQQGGVAIYRVALDGEVDTPRVIRVKRPSLFRVMWYAFTARMGLRPHPLGGFGGLLPVYSGGGG
jgi:hypothetical protein